MSIPYKIALTVLSTLMYFTAYLTAQNLEGRVTDTNGEPIVGANIFIESLNKGITCNEKGYYQLNSLPTGTYSVTYRSLGYEQQEFSVQIKPNINIVKDVQLKEKEFLLKETTVTAKTNPANYIMQNAIAKAPQYAKAVQSYTAEVYMKGGGKVNKVSKLIDKLSKNEDSGLKLSDMKGEYFVLESFNQLKYTAPNHYEQNILAISSTVPKEFLSDEDLPIINSSLYNPKDYSLISPLHPKAFNYYRFEYEGYWKENDLIINKIKVIPKVNDSDLYSGSICIVEDKWYIYSADLNCNIFGITENDKILYQNFGNDIYLPISYTIKTDIKNFGLDLQFNYYASLTYTDISKASNHEETTKAQSKKKRSFNVEDTDSYDVKKDSMAQKRDSTYWRKIRVLPLDTLEINSYKNKQTVQIRLDSIKHKKQSGVSVSDILVGTTIKADSSRFRFKYDGLLLVAPEYNFVDGFHLGQKFELNYRWQKNRSITLTPFAYYATARKRMLAGSKIQLNYAPMRLGKLSISGGSNTEDFNPIGINRTYNALSSLLRGKNYDYLYQKDYIEISNEIELLNGLTVETALDVAKRSGLDNHTDYTWGSKKNTTPNLNPANRFDRTAYTVTLYYTPYLYYKIQDDKKEYVKSQSPTFVLQITQAFSGWQTNNSRFIRLRAAIFHSITTSEFSNFNYNIQGGSFVGPRDKIAYADYQTFQTSNTPLDLKSGYNTFLLLNNYQASTNHYWISGIMNYSSKYLLLKYIPYFQGKAFRENLHWKSLYTQTMKPYTELGYSVNFIGLFNAGIYASFEKTKYKDWGVRVSIDINSVKRMID